MTLDSKKWTRVSNFSTEPSGNSAALALSIVYVLNLSDDNCSDISGSDLSIESSGVGALNAFVNVPWIGSIFEVSRTRGDTVRNLVFETGQLPNSRFRRKHSTRNSRGQ